MYVSVNNTALDLIKLELEVLQRQNESLTQNPKNLTAERDLCRNSECSLGNLITDAMVAATNGDNIWGGNATSIGIFPAVDLQPNATIPEGTYAKAECLVQGNQKVSGHLTFTVQSLGAQRLFDHPVL